MTQNRDILPEKKVAKYTEKAEKLRKDFIVSIATNSKLEGTFWCLILKNYSQDTLGDDGVFFYPAFCLPAFKHYESLSVLSGVVYSKFFNVMGFPSCHVPMGLNHEGLPIGFQVSY